MKYSFLALILLALLSCKSSRNSIPKQESKTSRFENISENQFISVVETDTLKLTDIYFENEYASFKTAEAMYIHLGIWDEVIRTSKAELPMLVWNNVKLLPTDSIPYNVVTSGGKTKAMFYASMMVLNNEGEDLLTSENKVFKNQIIEWMGNKINTIQEGDFYHKYMKVLDPKYRPVRYKITINGKHL